MTTRVFMESGRDGSMDDPAVRTKGSFTSKTEFEPREMPQPVGLADGTLVEFTFDRFDSGGVPSIWGVWRVTVLHKGDLFDRVEVARPGSRGFITAGRMGASDSVFLRRGIKKAWQLDYPLERGKRRRK